MSRVYDYDTFPSDPRVGDVLNLCFAYDEKSGLRLFDVNYPEGENIRLACVAVVGAVATFRWRIGFRAMEIGLGPQRGDDPSGKIRFLTYAAPHQHWEFSHAR